MLTPAAPKAGPTGGDGFAAPPLTCSLTTLLTSFAIVQLIYNFDRLYPVPVFPTCPIEEPVEKSKSVFELEATTLLSVTIYFQTFSTCI
jgi:hypothetical protein